MTEVRSLPETKVELIDQLAAIEHERWADWQRYFFSKCERNGDGSLTVPAGYVDALEKQIRTSYNDLSDEERASDRGEVLRYWPYVRAFFEGRGADPSLP
jgi:hypothetical protein